MKFLAVAIISLSFIGRSWADFRCATMGNRSDSKLTRVELTTKSHSNEIYLYSGESHMGIFNRWAQILGVKLEGKVPLIMIVTLGDDKKCNYNDSQPTIVDCQDNKAKVEFYKSDFYSAFKGEKIGEAFTEIRLSLAKYTVDYWRDRVVSQLSHHEMDVHFRTTNGRHGEKIESRYYGNSCF